MKNKEIIAIIGLVINGGSGMIKENQELDHLRLKKQKLDDEIVNCFCQHGGIGLGGFVRQPCPICKDRDKEIERINKRVAKIESKESDYLDNEIEKANMEDRESEPDYWDDSGDWGE